MADKNIQKALYGPSYLEVGLSAFLGILVGIVAAVLYFVFKPVEKVLQMPKAPVANVVYYMPGKENSSRSKGWQAKQKTFVEGGEIVLREEELNAWGATLSDFKPADPKAPAKPGTPPKPAAPAKSAAPANPGEPVVEDKDVYFAVGAPNFSLRENRLQVAAICHFDYYGIGSDVWVKATGRFTHTAEGYKFTPAEFYFGSCPLHLIPVALDFVMSKLIAQLKITDEMQLAWSKTTLITMDGEQLRIVTKP